MRGTMMDFPLTLISILERARTLFSHVEIVSRAPDKRIVRHTQGDFYKRARKLSAALRIAGLEKGDRVATLMWNHHAHLEAYFGVPCAGGVLHTLNLRLHPDDLAYIIQHAGDRFLLIDDVLLPLFEKVRERVQFEKVIVVNWKHGELPSYAVDYETFLASAPDDSESFPYPKLDENDAMGLCYTSGTTGKPKGVLYSHRAVVLHSFAVTSVDGLAMGRADTVLPVVPQFHVNAWGIPFAAVMSGTKQVFPGPHLDPHSLLELFEAEKVTLAAGVPTVWMAILEALEKEPQRYKLTPNMRMVVGGSAVPEAMIRSFDKHGLRIIHAWGMTETTPLGTVANLSPEQRNADEDTQYASRARQGVPNAFVEIRAVNDQGEVPWDGRSVGELQVRGPWIAAKYFRLEDTSDRWTDDGWFRTGDVVSIDAMGSMKITDRTKDLIKSGGEWISSIDLENALMGHPAVREAAVVAIAHPKWAERPLAVVALRPGATVTHEELNAFLAPRFAKWWLPDATAFVESIPRTSAGKFLKSALRDQFANWKWETTE